MHCLPHAMLQITLESSFHLSLSPAIFLNMSKSSLVLNCLPSIPFLMFPSTLSLCNFTGNVTPWIPLYFLTLSGISKYQSMACWHGDQLSIPLLYVIQPYCFRSRIVTFHHSQHHVLHKSVILYPTNISRQSCPPTDNPVPHYPKLLPCSQLHYFIFLSKKDSKNILWIH